MFSEQSVRRFLYFQVNTNYVCVIEIAIINVIADWEIN